MYLAANSTRRRITKACGEYPNVPLKEREKCASLRPTRAHRCATSTRPMICLSMLRSSRVVNGLATGDFPDCASEARALEVTSMFGVRETRVPRLNFVYQPALPIQSLVDPHSADSKICSAPPVDERQVRHVCGYASISVVCGQT